MFSRNDDYCLFFMTYVSDKRAHLLYRGWLSKFFIRLSGFLRARYILSCEEIFLWHHVIFRTMSWGIKDGTCLDGKTGNSVSLSRQCRNTINTQYFEESVCGGLRTAHSDSTFVLNVFAPVFPCFPSVTARSSKDLVVSLTVLSQSFLPTSAIYKKTLHYYVLAYL